MTGKRNIEIKQQIGQNDGGICQRRQFLAFWNALQSKIVQNNVFPSCALKLTIIIQLNAMNKKKASSNSRSKRPYARICLKKRKLLVRMVYQQGLSIAGSIKKLKIKLTTARLILKKYKESGTFPMRKFKKIGKMHIDLPTNIKTQDDDNEDNGVVVKQENFIEPLLKQQQEQDQKYKQFLDFSGESSQGNRKGVQK